MDIKNYKQIINCSIPRNTVGASVVTIDTIIDHYSKGNHYYDEFQMFFFANVASDDELISKFSRR